MNKVSCDVQKRTIAKNIWLFYLAIVIILWFSYLKRPIAQYES